MSEDEFRSICAAADRLLREPTVDEFARVANPWLHVVRPHPVFLKQYEKVFSPKASVSKLAWTRNIARNIFNFLRSLKNTNIDYCGEKPVNANVLIISHLVNLKFAGSDTDFYFGDAAEKLQKAGISSAYCLINYTRESAAELADKWTNSKTPRLILKPVLSLARELNLWWRFFAEARRFKLSLENAECEIHRRMAYLAGTGSAVAISAMRTAEQIKLLVKELRPKAVLLTYEGHAWERLTFAAVREVMPNTICVGYHHAALFKLQHAMQRKLSSQYNPDIILTAGKLAQNRLKANPDLKDVKIEVLGSPKRVEVSQDIHKANTIMGCLVIPEGTEEECRILFEYSLRCAEVLPDLNFIWRLHPAISLVHLVKKNPRFRKLPRNIRLSNASLQEDLGASSWALYRGTTAIVEAVASGATPIYLKRKNEITIDPLYEVQGYQINSHSVKEFVSLTRAGADNRLRMSEISRYCEDMFTSLDVGPFVNFLKKKDYRRQEDL